jgi:hypothetical protein
MKTPLLGIVMAVAAAAQTYPVAGVVTDGVHNAPVERARVILSDESGGRHALTTGADGRFAFTVPEGKYTLYAERMGWRIVYGSSGPWAGFGSAVIAGPGKDTAHLALRWYPPGAIYGKVVDEQDEPVRDATVQLMRDGVFGGRRRILEADYATTDDRGEYRVAPLAAGTYYTLVTAKPWYAMADSSPDTGAIYPATYYPGATDIREAAPVTLKSGAEVEADVPLRATTGVHVHVRCPGSGRENDGCPGDPVLTLHSFAGIGAYLEPDPDAVPPGRYTLLVKGGDKTARRIVDVGSGDLTVDLTLKPDPLITGKVSFKSGPPKPGATLYVGLVDETSGNEVDAPVEPGGAFRFANTGGSRFRPYLYGSAKMFIAKLSAQGAPFKDGLVDLTEETVAHLDILASDETGRLKGYAMNGDKPAPAVMVVLVPRATAADPAEPLGNQTESDGSFDYESVPAGDYLLFAVDKLDFEYANPEVTRPYLAAATAVHIPAHGVAEQRVPVAAGAGK